MAIEHVSKLIVFDDSLANIYALTGALVELQIGRNTETGDLYYSVDQGATWTAITAGGSGEVLVEDGSAAPPVMLTNEDEDDFLYEG